jgi:hypothetical protein
LKVVLKPLIWYILNVLTFLITYYMFIYTSWLPIL